jgi:hypothetical protein
MSTPRRPLGQLNQNNLPPSSAEKMRTDMISPSIQRSGKAFLIRKI